MSRKTGQLVALFSIIVLIVVVTGYQYFSFNGLKGDVLQTGYEGTTTTVQPSEVLVPPAPAVPEPVAGITVSPLSGLTTTESGGTAGFSVVLSRVPTSDVSLVLNSGNPGEGSVSPTSLVFTSSNAFTPQSVTVTGVDDAVVDGNVVYSIVIQPAISTDPTYSGFDAPDVSVTNTDNDVAPAVPPSLAAAIVAEPLVLRTSEAATSAQFTVVLSTVPTADVTIALSSSNVLEGTIVPADLTFTSTNALIPQTVTVTGVDDALVDGDSAFSIVLAPAVSTDPVYNGMDPADVTVTNADNDAVQPVPLPTATESVCGNGALETGEQCDDGNLIDGDGCNAICKVVAVIPENPELQPNPASNSVVEGGITVFKYIVPVGEKVVLDALQLPEVSSATNIVRWSTSDPDISINDLFSVRTFFIPQKEGDVSFSVDLRHLDGRFLPLPFRYDFSVVSALAYSADANHDGAYDFNDLLNLLQNWDSFGDKSTTILSVILSRYQGE